MKFKTILFFSFLICVISFSCTFQKRAYRKGYYVHWNSNKSKKELLHPKSDLKHVDAPFATKKKETSQLNSDAPIIASSDKDFYINPKEIRKDSVNAGCGDSIWFRNGLKIKVTVLEVNDESVKYATCGNYASKTITVSKKELSRIKYKNGSYEFYEDFGLKKEAPQNTSRKSKSTSSMATASLINAILSFVLLCVFFGLMYLFLVAIFATGWLIVFIGIMIVILLIIAIAALVFWILAGVFSIKALVDYRNNPDQSKGKGRAIAAFTIFCLLLLLFLAIFIFFATFSL